MFGKGDKGMNNELVARAQTACDAIRSPSLTESMTERKGRLEVELAEVTALLERLEANPDAAELFDAISRLGGLRY